MLWVTVEIVTQPTALHYHLAGGVPVIVKFDPANDTPERFVFKESLEFVYDT